jgi:hypothetical protein
MCGRGYAAHKKPLVFKQKKYAITFWYLFGGMAMDNIDMKLKEGVVLSEKDVLDMACALRSIGFYFYSVCGDEEHPEELREVLNDGIKAVNRLFE